MNKKRAKQIWENIKSLSWTLGTYGTGVRIVKPLPSPPSSSINSLYKVTARQCGKTYGANSNKQCCYCEKNPFIADGPTYRIYCSHKGKTTFSNPICENCFKKLYGSKVAKELKGE